MENIRATLRRLAIAINNVDEVYCTDMAKIGVKESELWLMYALNDGEQHSQKQICDEWGFPRTTLNTAIKQAEAAGYLTMSLIPGKRREMNICLTEKGKVHAEKLLNIIYMAENKAMEETLKHYSADFIDAVEYFATHFKSAFEGQLEERKKITDL